MGVSGDTPESHKVRYTTYHKLCGPFTSLLEAEIRICNLHNVLTNHILNKVSHDICFLNLICEETSKTVLKAITAGFPHINEVLLGAGIQAKV